MKEIFSKPSAVFALFAAVLLGLAACKNSSNEEYVYDANPKGSTHFTDSTLEVVYGSLDFTQAADLKAANMGFKKSLDINQRYITENGDTIFDLYAYDFIPPEAYNGEYPTTVNPSLWRQSYLNQMHGLFELQERKIYQIRAFDLANMSFVYDDDGKWIVIDPLGSPGTAKAGLDLFNDYLVNDLQAPPAEISAIIFTHSHIDHFGGVKGILDEVGLANTPIYAPEGFFEESVSENVMAGNCMGRRASYMYGNLLEKSQTGTVGTGLGTTTSAGIAGIAKETVTISGTEIQKETIGNLEVEFLFAPSSEAPAEMMFYFPLYEAFCQAEDLNHTLHNLYTLRGAKVRDGQKWSKYIDRVIAEWGGQARLSFGSHHWPTTGKDTILTFWEKQRDLYRFIHDQTLRLANQGLTPRELADTIQLPDSLSKEFYNRGYYGSLSHDIKAQYQLYFGWFDGNPANLNPLPPSESGKKYIKYFSEDALLNAGKEAFLDGEYRWAAELLNHLVFGNPDNQDARFLLADTYEQMGYQAESGPWRNFYLSGAKELRTGVIEASTPNTAGPDMIAGMSNELLFDFLAMHFIGTDKEAAEMDYSFAVRIKVGDLNPSVVPLDLIVSRGAVTPRFGVSETEGQSGQVEVARSDLDRIFTEGLSLEDLIQEHSIHFSTPQTKDDFKNFAMKLDSFQFWFPIVEP